MTTSRYSETRALSYSGLNCWYGGAVLALVVHGVHGLWHYVIGMYNALRLALALQGVA